MLTIRLKRKEKDVQGRTTHARTSTHEQVRDQEREMKMNDALYEVHEKKERHNSRGKRQTGHEERVAQSQEQELREQE